MPRGRGLTRCWDLWPQIDKDSSLKAKVDSTGLLSAIYQQKIRPQMTIKVSGQVSLTVLRPLLCVCGQPICLWTHAYQVLASEVATLAPSEGATLLVFQH